MAADVAPWDMNWEGSPQVQQEAPKSQEAVPPWEQDWDVSNDPITLPPSTGFDDAFKVVIGEEGGLVNNPKDKGGLTKYGIAQKFHPNVDVENLTLDQAKEIYKKQYWDKYNLESFPAGERSEIFDMVVNSPVRATKAIQRATGTTPSGKLGKATREAMRSYKGDLGRDSRYEYIKSLASESKDWTEFGNGWANRYLNVDMFGDDAIDLEEMDREEVVKILTYVHNSSKSK